MEVELFIISKSKNIMVLKNISFIACLLMFVSSTLVQAVNRHSVYTQKPMDSEAYYFTPENYGFKADGKSDVTEALQQAIFQVKREKNFGILFIPEGEYRISKTIQVPSSVRLIGYGKNVRSFIWARRLPDSRKGRTTCCGLQVE